MRWRRRFWTPASALRASPTRWRGSTVASALGELAVACRHVRPKVDGSTAFRIVHGRHPVVEAALAADHAKPFVPNDCDLSPDANGRVWLVTGPNMAGKSTFLRQNALIAVMAQIGAFVPADEAHIGIVDKLFSRVGAADDLARGRSTFMGRDGRDRGDPQSGDRAQSRDPRRDRPRHGDLRRPRHRMGPPSSICMKRISPARSSPRIITR